MKWWFPLGRDGRNRMPSLYYEQPLPFPDILWNTHTILCIVIFSIPLSAFIIILPSFRKKHWPSFLVVVLCFVAGVVITVVFGSSSWLVGKVEVFMPVGPQQPPIKGILGIWAGLWHVNLTYDTPFMYLNERVEWTGIKDFKNAHREALANGWPWALLSLTAELGGEGIAWHGSLGFALFSAGSMASYSLVGAIVVWAVWVLLFTVMPELTARPFMLTGFLLTSSSCLYVIFIQVHQPTLSFLCGQQLKLQLGWAWWLTGGFGAFLTLIGIGLLIYKYKYPARFSTIFEMDFGTTSSQHLLQTPGRSSERLFAFEKPQENYSQLYPSSESFIYFSKDHYKETHIETFSKKHEQSGNNVDANDLNVIKSSAQDSSKIMRTPEVAYFHKSELEDISKLSPMPHVDHSYEGNMNMSHSFECPFSANSISECHSGIDCRGKDHSNILQGDCLLGSVPILDNSTTHIILNEKHMSLQREDGLVLRQRSPPEQNVQIGDGIISLPALPAKDSCSGGRLSRQRNSIPTLCASSVENRASPQTSLLDSYWNTHLASSTPSESFSKLTSSSPRLLSLQSKNQEKNELHSSPKLKSSEDQELISYM